MSLVTLPGCASSPQGSPSPPDVATPSLESETTKAPETSASPVADLPDVCARWSGAQVAAALSGTDYGPATVLRSDQEGGTSACDWALPEPLRRELGMDASGDPSTTTAVEIRIFPYGTDLSLERDGSEVVSSPQDVVRVRTADPDWTSLQGAPPAAMGGTPVVDVATEGSTWFELMLFMCDNSQCGDQAIVAARTLSADNT